MPHFRLSLFALLPVIKDKKTGKYLKPVYRQMLDYVDHILEKYEFIRLQTLKVSWAEHERRSPMKKWNRFSVGVVALYLVLTLLIFLSSCAGTNVNQGASGIQNPESPPLQTPFAKEAYKLLAAEVEIYNAAWLSFKDLHEAGIVSDADFEKGRDLARKFYKKYTRAVDLVLAYEKGTMNQGEAKSAVDLALSANKILQEYLKPKLPKRP